jgi:small subunit ribosomal protein S13
MIQIFNNYFKKEITILTALRQLSGIGKSMSVQMCDVLGLGKSTLLGSLSTFQVNQLDQLIHQNYHVGTELRNIIKKNKNRLRVISSYRGWRHSEGLPCRGQRTHGNARTSRRVGSIRKVS